MINCGLILEGGGMRGVYTAGVLDYFMEKNLYFKDCYAVSAGACHAISYYSKQKGRSIKVNLDYLHDKRYCSINSLIKTGDLFGVDMIYNIIPNELVLFDYDTYNKNEGNFYSVVTNCDTGKAEYIKIIDAKKDITAVRASSSLPLLSRIVEFNGNKYLDGGIADSIPIKKSIEDGHNKNVLVLTRDSSYRKEPSKFMPIFKMKYKKYPNLINSLENRYKVYNDTLEFIYNERKKDNVFIIQPKNPVDIKRLEKDKEKLRKLYNQGYNDAKDSYEELMQFLS